MAFDIKKYQADTEEQRKQRGDLLKQHELEKNKKGKKNKFIIFVVLAVTLLIAGAYVAYSYFVPGPYDNFAKCLTEKGAVMYGAISWCKYTQAQSYMFGKSFKYINYKDESQLAGLKTRPTWVINNKWYEKVQSFETLAEATGCPI